MIRHYSFFLLIRDNFRTFLNLKLQLSKSKQKKGVVSNHNITVLLVGHLWIKTSTSAKVSNFTVRDKDLPLPWQLLLYTSYHNLCCFLDAVQSLSRVGLFVTPWTAGHQTSLSFTISWSLLKFLSQLLKIIMHEDIILESRYYLKDQFKKYYHKIIYYYCWC